MGTMLYNILIYPIEMVVEFVYSFFYKGFNNPGLSIAAISIVVSLLALPLYAIAESLQKKERDERIRLQPGVDRIKTAFKGDEQYMMLSTFYKQNNYHPAYALRSSISLLIQVPFFIAAYHFLSHLEQLQGQRFFFIADLGAPDGLLALGGLSMNLLPLAMTLINIIAGAIYTKGFPLRDKLQLYGMAALFLVLLYTSPAGLVLYWTLNNVFSLGKNLFYKLKHPIKVLYVISVVGVCIVVAALWIKFPDLVLIYKLISLAMCGVIILLPVFLAGGNIIYERYLLPLSHDNKQRNLVFIFSCLLFFITQGMIVPANLIASSTIEFSFLGTVENPLSYVLNTITIFFGVWMVWGSIFYMMGNRKSKTIIAYIFCIFSLSALLNLFVFKGDYGHISKLLQYINWALLSPSLQLGIIPVIAFLLLGVIVLLLSKYRKVRYISTFMGILVLTGITSGFLSCATIQREFQDHKENMIARNVNFHEEGTLEPVFHLSREGNNVVYIFLDRAFSFYFPYIYNQFPEMEKQFQGFVYYPNTVSYGGFTIFGAPPMMGGYEYTPDAINARSTEKLVKKHNEASLVLPRLFLDGGYSITITDPPYSNYKWSGDYTPFDAYPEIEVLQHLGKFTLNYKNEFGNVLEWTLEEQSRVILRRMPLFSILKTSFPVVRKLLYDSGRYFQADESSLEIDDFIDSYGQLYYLRELTDFVSEKDSFTFISNDTPHQPIFLQAPLYEPQTIVTDKSTPLDTIPEINDFDLQHYHVNAASLRQIGLWLEKLQEAGAYDNTRIIIVADHGFDLYSEGFSEFSKNNRLYGRFNPLLLLKDFNETGVYRTDNSFMTNADAALFAIQGLPLSTLNPFTQKDLFESVDKMNVRVYSGPWNPDKHSSNIFTFNYAESFSVHDSIFEESNWIRLE